MWFNQLLHHYDQAIWARFFGQVISSLGNFMISPFISLYLYEKLHVSLMTTMLVVSVSPVVSLFLGFVAGPLADIVGRKPMMLTSIFGQSATLFLYLTAHNAWQFALVTVIQGVFGALYFPAASAQIIDVVPENQRSEVFALLHMGLNIGAAVGPLFGASFFKTAPHMLFTLAAIASLLSGVVIWLFVPESRSRETAKQAGKRRGRSTAIETKPRGNVRDIVLVSWITLLSLPVTLLYAQVRTNLPIHLQAHFADYVHVFALMQTVNGTLVIVLQMLIVRITRQMRVWALLLFSFMMFALVGVGYGFAPSLFILLVTEFIFTLGEMIGFPQLQNAIAMLAPEHQRGLYFAIFGLRWSLGSIIGPLFGGWLMRTVGGLWMFLVIGLMLAVAGILLVATLLTEQKKSRIETSSVVA